MITYPRYNDVLNTLNRGNAAASGLCTLCLADCRGRCETWMSSLLGRNILYPREFGNSTTGSLTIKQMGVSYNSFRIQGYLYGAEGLPPGITDSPDESIFPNVSLETEFGNRVKTKSTIPIMTGALGSTLVAQKYWNPIAIGAALVGFPVVIGENVVGVDPQAEFINGELIRAPELDRRLNVYFRYYDGYGSITVQLNVEDIRNGVAEYVTKKYGNKVIIELKWGQGAKDIGGEIQIDNLNYALFLKRRGYIVIPDPSLPEVQKAYREGAIMSFERHSRMNYTNLDSYEEVREDFMKMVDYLRELGFMRITLKTGAYGMGGLAMAIKFASEAGLDLLTIDGAGGGTGMSPWNMMQMWGVPSVFLHSKAYEYASMLESKGERVVDMSFAGGLAREDHIFKALALGANYTKFVCMGRALMIPAFLGSNIEGVLRPERKEVVNGQWDELPNNVTEIGTTAEEIFAAYYDVRNKVGEEEMKYIPYGAIAMWTHVDKIMTGLRQFLAGARKFSVQDISRSDIVSPNRAMEEVTNIQFITEAEDEIAKNIINL